MSAIAAPDSEEALSGLIKDAAARKAPIEIRGGGTRRDIGRPMQAEETISLDGLRGVTLYEPGALTVIAQAGTPLADVEAALGAEGQRLAFEPPDWRALLGSEGEPTIGGAVATNFSGPRRIQTGACRDSLIGVRFVDGSGEILKNGGRVMKNVTGYDLVKLLCGSYGSLGVLTEVAFKVGPAPESAVFLMMQGLDDATAIAALSAGLGSPYEVTGAAHLPEDCTPEGDGAVTMLRLEGFAENMAHRGPALRALLSRFGAVELIEDPAQVASGWAFIRNVEPFARTEGAVWRISVKPTDGPIIGARLRESLGARVFYDWGGGLVWALVPEEAEGDAGAALIRREIAALGGHATLIRGSASLRAAAPVFHPEPPALARLTAEIKAKFDPAGVLNPGRIVN
ncbi:MAG: FAD-binding protein [Pseudomonadota bacterium]